MTDPVAELIRGERDALLQVAPAPHAARLWHEARRRRAASLRTSMRAVGWLVRLALAAATLISFAALRPEAYFLLLLFSVSVWLTGAACAPVRPLSMKG
jgi:hypothetical protein